MIVLLFIFTIASVLAVMICMSAAIVSKRNEIRFIEMSKRKED